MKISTIPEGKHLVQTSISLEICLQYLSVKNIRYRYSIIGLTKDMRFYLHAPTPHNRKIVENISFKVHIDRMEDNFFY